jgi:cupin 2 domain-containing protein
LPLTIALFPREEAKVRDGQHPSGNKDFCSNTSARTPQSDKKTVSGWILYSSRSITWTQALIMSNIFSAIPAKIEKEICETLLQAGSLRIERIVSRGHTSPDNGWYDQNEHEWVIVLEGSGRILFEDGNEVQLAKGDYIYIPAHQKHKVSWTDPDMNTIWLAVFHS